MSTLLIRNACAVMTGGLSAAARSDATDILVQQGVIARMGRGLVAPEGARVLDEGIASKASDIDMVYVSGYGFPLYRGGPMHYANEVGIMNVLAAMQRFAEMDTDNRQAGAWRPAQGLLAG